MRGDFTRDSFNAAKRFRRVLLQQGRVQLDADFNEQASILLRYGQALATDLIGRFGGPKSAIDDAGRAIANDAFNITLRQTTATLEPGDVQIGAGHYYVDGLLCENPTPTTFADQDDLPPNPDGEGDTVPGAPFLVYLEVFERSLAAAQDDGIAEPALEGLDTAARSRVIGQVKLIAVPSDQQNNLFLQEPPSAVAWNAWLDVLDREPRGMLRAMTGTDVSNDGGPCIVPVASAFRGEDNQLYRVEIHDAGADGTATFKWSRENGSVIFPVETLVGNVATVATLGRDRRFGLEPGDWVEVIDDQRELRRFGSPKVLPLFQVDSIGREDRTVTLKPQKDVTIPAYDGGSASQAIHPLLRRWDGGRAKTIEEVSAPTDAATPLENGVQIQFVKPANSQANLYRAGDYWLIPARVALGDIIWPSENGVRSSLPPNGIDRHFAPLATIARIDGPLNIFDLRRLFGPIGT